MVYNNVICFWQCTTIIIVISIVQESEETFPKHSSVVEFKVHEPVHGAATTESDGQSLIMHSPDVPQEDVTVVPHEEVYYTVGT